MSRNALACWVALAGACTGANASPPLDFVIPYTAFDDGRHGVTLVDSADFQRTRELVPSTQPIDAAVFTLPLGDPPRERRLDQVLLGIDGHWMKASLRDGLSPPLVQVSSESQTADVCTSRLIATSHGADARQLLFYTVATSTEGCFSFVDGSAPPREARRIDIDDPADVAPIVIRRFDVTWPQPSYDADGVLTALYAKKGRYVRRLDADLVTVRDVYSGVCTWWQVGTARNGDVIMAVNGQLHAVDAKGVPRPSALYTPTTGFFLGGTTLIDDELWISEYSQSSPQRTRILRLTLGSSRAIPVIEEDHSASIWGISARRLFYVVYGDTVTPGKDTPTRLKSVRHDGSLADARPVELFRIQAQSSIRVAALQDRRVFLAVNRPDVQGPDRSHAYVIDLEGQLVRDFGPGSDFPGSSTLFTTLPRLHRDRLLLTHAGIEGTTRGMRLASLETETLVVTEFGRLPTDTFDPAGDDLSIATLRAGTGDAQQTDAFVYDLEGLRVQRLSKGTPVNESGLNGGGANAEMSGSPDCLGDVGAAEPLGAAPPTP